MSRTPEELLAALDALGLAAWTAEPETLTLTGATAEGRTLLGLAEGEPLPCWAERLNDAHRQALVEAARSRVATALTHRVAGPDRSRWIRVELRFPSGALLAVASEAESLRALVRERASAYIDAVVDHLPFEFYELDHRGLFVRDNARIRARHGRLAGKRLDELALPEEIRALWSENLARAYAGELIQQEREIATEAERRTMFTLVSPLHDGAQVVGVVGINLDLSHLRRVEADRDRLARQEREAREAAELAERRTQELVGELRRSFEELDRAQVKLVSRERLAALGELAAVVAHEVRNPLGAIFNAVGSLKKHLPRDGDPGLLLGIIDEEATRLDVMVRELLDYARPVHPQLVKERIEPLLQDALSSALRAGGPLSAQVETRIEVAPELGTVAMDAGLLRMALTNLFTNALQAMPEGGKLTVVAQPETHDGSRWVEIQVRDTGRGIPVEHLPRIFEPFYTTRAAGTGLGLAVVRRIMEAHHGAVVAFSQPGEGSTFALYLPR